MNHRRVLPFYMTYPLPVGYQEENAAIKDFEYLQQLYPIEAKRYYKRVMETLDRLDYEGSIIYDEYPDQWQLHKLSRDILDKIRVAEPAGEGETSSEKWEWRGDLILIMLYNEVFRRRHCAKNGTLYF